MVKKIFLGGLSLTLIFFLTVPFAHAVTEKGTLEKELSAEETSRQNEEIDSLIKQISEIVLNAVKDLLGGKNFLDFVSGIPKNIKEPLSAIVTRFKGVSPGTYQYEGIKVIVNSAGNILVEGVKTQGSSSLSFTFDANGRLALNGTASVGVGRYTCSSVTFTINDALQYSGNGQITLPLVGTTNFTLTGTGYDYTATAAKAMKIAGKTQSVTFTVTKDTFTGSGDFTLPVLGPTEVTIKGDNKEAQAIIQAKSIDLGGGATLSVRSIQIDSSGNLAATGDVLLGSYRFANASLGISSSGKVTLNGSASINIEGFSQVFTLDYDGKTVNARTAAGVKLGGYNFTAAVLEISSNGTVVLAGNPNGSFNIGGLVMTFLLKYEKAQLYAEGTAGISLGGYTYPLARFEISSTGLPKLSGPLTKTFDIGGVSATYTLKYENGVLFAETAAGISLGSYQFVGAKFRIDSKGTVTLAGTTTNNFTVAGVTAGFTLKYEGGVLCAESTGGVSLGSYAFSSARLKIGSDGSVSLTGTTSATFTISNLTASFNLKLENLVLVAEGSTGISLGGYTWELAKFKISAGGIPNLDGPLSKTFTIGGISASYTLKYEGGVLFAEGAAGLSLGSYQFAGAKFTISSNGTVSLGGTTSNNFTVAGITGGFTLKHVSGTLYAESTAGVSLGSYAFSSAKLKIASNGTVTLTGTTTNNFTIAGITAGFTLKYENGVLSAESTGGLSLGSYAFSSAKLNIASNGTVTLAGTTSNNFTMGGVTTSFALKLENATLYAEGAAGISLGGYTWQAAKFKISAGGVPNLDGTLSKSITIAGQSLSFTLKYANGELYAESAAGLSLGSYTFSSAKFKISSNGTVMLAGNTANSFTIYGLTASFTLMYANSTLSAEGAAGVSLGGYSFPEAKIKISTSGLSSLVGNCTKSFSIGGTSVSLTLNNDGSSLYAQGTANVSLGSYTFSNASFRVTSSGVVSVTASQNFTIAGKGITFNLHLANNAFSATGTFNITIAGNGFNNCTATLSSSGGVTASGSATISIPHPCYPKVWNVCYSSYTATLAYANGEFNYSY